jgi:hypothetical protein
LFALHRSIEDNDSLSFEQPFSEPDGWTTQTTLAEQQAMLIEAGFEPELWQEVEGQEGSTQVDITKVNMNLSCSDACYEYNKELDSDDHDYPMVGEPGYDPARDKSGVDYLPVPLIKDGVKQYSVRDDDDKVDAAVIDIGLVGASQGQNDSLAWF